MANWDFKKALGKTGIIKKVSPEVNKDKKKTAVVASAITTKNIKRKKKRIYREKRVLMSTKKDTSQTYKKTLMGKT